MLTEQQLTSVLATERRIYAALSEVLELTGEPPPPYSGGILSPFSSFSSSGRSRSTNCGNTRPTWRSSAASFRRKTGRSWRGSCPGRPRRPVPLPTLQEQLQRNRAL